jgi:hypothetical protein
MEKNQIRDPGETSRNIAYGGDILSLSALPRNEMVNLLESVRSLYPYLSFAYIYNHKELILFISQGCKATRNQPSVSKSNKKRNENPHARPRTRTNRWFQNGRLRHYTHMTTTNKRSNMYDTYSHIFIFDIFIKTSRFTIWLSLIKKYFFARVYTLL